jgi:hypothetical protein
MKVRKAFFALTLSQPALLPAYADQQFSCSDKHLLTLHRSDGQNGARWGKVLSNGGVANCSFWEGHRFKNSDMGMFPSAVASKGIWIYRGLGNACSDNQLLIFSEQTNKVMIIRNYDFSTSIFECSDSNH